LTGSVNIVSLNIHVEIWIASRIVSQESDIFTKAELVKKIKDLFNDTRSGVSTHISSYCVASTKADPGAYRYLTRVGRGQYRVFRYGDEVHESKKEAPLKPNKYEIPSEYRYLLDISENIEKVETTSDSHTSLNKKMSEEEVRDYFMQILNARFSKQPEHDRKISTFKFDEKYGDYKCVAEGPLNYTLPNGTILSHKNDILIYGEDRSIAIEVKHRSAVTDQFKTRSYDALHIKKSNPNTVQIMLYVRDKSGISPSHAESISYPFDHFIHIDFKDINTQNKIEPLLTIIENVLLDVQG